MSDKINEEINNRVDQYYNCCDGDKDKIRNEIFLSMIPCFDKWIKKILSSNGNYMNDSERLSICWDCFLFCLKYYKPNKNIPILKHSYHHTRFFLLSLFSDQNNQKRREINVDFNLDTKQEEKEENPDFNFEINQGKNNDPAIYYEQIDELRRFRKGLTEDYQKIFDDAILSMAGSNKDKVGYIQTTAYHKYKYQEAKKVFKFVIDFLLRR